MENPIESESQEPAASQLKVVNPLQAVKMTMVRDQTPLVLQTNRGEDASRIRIDVGSQNSQEWLAQALIDP